MSVTRRQVKEDVSKQQTGSTSMDDMVQLDMAKLEKIVSKCIKAELEPIRRQLTEMQTTFDKRLQDLEKENKGLTNKCNQLAATLKISEARLEDLEQYSRNCNVQINGVPQMPGPGDENAVILQVLSQRLNVPIDAAVDVQAIHRIPSAAACKPVIIQFSNRQLRKKVIVEATKAKLKKRDFNPGDSDPDAKVFVGDHLTVKNKQLLREARQQKTEGKLEAVMIREGKILVRKEKDGRLTRFSQ